MFLWAICFPFITVGLEYAPPLLFGSLRALIAGGSLLYLAYLLGRDRPRGLRVWCDLTLVGITATSVGFWGMFNAGGILAPGIATVLTNTQPLIAAVLGYYLLKEVLKSKGLVGLILGFLGIIVICIGSLITDNAITVRGVVYVLIGTIGIAISNVILKRIAGQVDVLSAMGWQLFIGAVPLGLLGLALEEAHSIQWGWSFIVNLLVLSLVGTSLVFVLWFWVLQHAPLYQLNSYTFLTPIFGMGLGVVFFDETVSALQLSGILMSFYGIWLVNQKNVSSESAAPSR